MIPPDTLPADQLAAQIAERKRIQADFYKLWNAELIGSNVALRNYKVEALAWRFYLAGRRAQKPD